MKKAIIYDWDGTLCNSIPAAFMATQSIFELHCVPPPTFETYIGTFGPPYTSFYWENGLPRTVTEEQIWLHYMECSLHAEADLFEEVFETICTQRSYGYAIGLVTGQRISVLNTLMQKHKCSGLFDCIFAETNPSKVSAFRDACKVLNVPPAETYSVGDFATDMRDSVLAGVIPVGIVRSTQDVSHLLMQAGAKKIIRTISELPIQ